MNDLSFLDTLQGKKILFAPLDWGLGHATRSSVIIDRLSIQNEIQIATSGIALKWLINRFPGLPYHTLPSYDIRYRFGTMWLNIMASLPHLMKSVARERKIINKLMTVHNYDLIIADHRFGTYSKKCQSVVIAHQIQIPHTNKILAYCSSQMNAYLLNQYDEVWIPDYRDSQLSLSGILSKNTKLRKSKYIGPMSMITGEGSEIEEKIDIAVILSGPEPSRSNVEHQLSLALEPLKDLNITLIRGSDTMAHDGILMKRVFKSIIDIADHNAVKSILSRSSQIICRSGYTTIMDLDALKKKAILIPTKNQPEQEYLAEYHRARAYQSIDEATLEKEPNSLCAMLDLS